MLRTVPGWLAEGLQSRRHRHNRRRHDLALEWRGLQRRV